MPEKIAGGCGTTVAFVLLLAIGLGLYMIFGKYQDESAGYWLIGVAVACGIFSLFNIMSMIDPD